MLALEKDYQAQGKSLDAPEADGLTARQRFFLNYAFSWCADERPEAARNQVMSNPHSLPRLPRESSGFEYAGVSEGI